MKLAIIFDFDGVIVDSLEVWGDAFISACKHHGCNLFPTHKSFLHLFEGNMYEGMKKAGVDDDTILEIRKKLVKGYMSDKHKVKLFAGVKEMLAELAEISKIYVVSSNFTEIAQSFWDSHKLAKCEEILGGDKGKSKVKKIESIKRKLPDREIIYVGDTKGDMIEGGLAGVKTVAVTWGWHGEEKLKKSEPDFIVKTPGELVTLAKVELNFDFN